MTLSWNAGDDFAEMVDGLQSVTFTPPGEEDVSVTAALLRRVTEQEAQASGGHYSQQDVLWHLPQSEIVAQPPLRSIITDGQNNAWTVLEVEPSNLTGRWRCVARKLAVADGLEDLLDLQQATWTKDAHGAQQAVWNTVQSDLPAHVQPLESHIEINSGARRFWATHTIYLQSDLNLDESHRFEQPATSRLFQVLKTQTQDRIDQLQQVLVREIS